MVARLASVPPVVSAVAGGPSGAAFEMPAAAGVFGAPLRSGSGLENVDEQIELPVHPTAGVDDMVRMPPSREAHRIRFAAGGWADRGESFPRSESKARSGSATVSVVVERAFAMAVRFSPHGSHHAGEGTNVLRREGRLWPRPNRISLIIAATAGSFAVTLGWERCAGHPGVRAAVLAGHRQAAADAAPSGQPRWSA